LFRYDAASDTYSRLIQLLTDSECFSSETCIISVPSVVSVYADCIAAHVKAALYDEAVMLCDIVLGKYSPLSSSFNALDTDSLPSQHTTDASDQSLESTGATRKRNRSVLSTDSDSVMQQIANEPIIAQIALHKTEALLELGRTDDALLCVDRLV